MLYLEYLPGNLCLPNLEPIRDANESPTPTVIRPLNCPKLKISKLEIQSGNDRPTSK